MSRARNIKPGFFTNGDLLECTPLARLLFAGLWCEADRRGILEDRPKTIKVKVLPGDDCDIEALLDELSVHGFIRRYEVDEARCIHIPNFGKHQNPHVKEQANTLPAPDMPGADPVQTSDNTGSSHADSLLLIPDSLIPITPPSGGEHRAGRIPDDFAVDEAMVAWASGKGFSQPEVAHHTEAFTSHWRGEAGPKARKLDWRQAWQTWLMRERPGRWPGAANGRASPLPDGVTWDQVNEWRNRIRGNFSVTDEQRRIVEAVDSRNGVAA